MKISVTTTIPKDQTLILFSFEKETAPCSLPQQKKLIEDAAKEGFKAKEYSTLILHPRSGSPAKQVILVGLGEKPSPQPSPIKGEGVTSETLRRAAATAIRKVQSLSQKSVSILLPNIFLDSRLRGNDDEEKNNYGAWVQKESCAISEGTLLSDYRFDKYKKPDKELTRIKEATLIVSKKELLDAKKGARLAQILSDSTCFARDLVNEPPSNLTPSKIADCAKKIAEKGKSCGISLTLFEKEKIEEMGMGALLGVNRGSSEPPVFVHLRYKPQILDSRLRGNDDKETEKSLKSVAFVGKGITFDSGGLSLKPAEAMETMKMDMAGAAAILGLFKAISYLKPKVEVHGILAVTENMPGGRAYKPGDILKTMNGKTIEVLNTDAEGRLVLSDALSYAVQQKPDVIIDIATLTGACIIALGSLVAGAMGNSDDLFNEIQKASEESGEKFWRLPLVEEYKDGLKSPVADIKNISSVRKEGGSIIGGLFLQEFVEGMPWLHLDIAGPAWTDKEFFYYSQGGTGFPTRTLIRYLLNFNPHFALAPSPYPLPRGERTSEAVPEAKRSGIKGK